MCFLPGKFRLLSVQLVVHPANELFPKILLGISTSQEVNASIAAGADTENMLFSRW